MPTNIAADDSQNVHGSKDGFKSAPLLSLWWVSEDHEPVLADEHQA
jgi:hypothetical protein